MAIFKKKTFSVKPLNKYDLFKIFGSSVSRGIGSGMITKSSKSGISASIMSLLLGSMEKLSGDEAAKLGVPTSRSNFNNPYLSEVLKRLHYVENYDYTIGGSDNELNISLFSGRFIITLPKKSKKVTNLDNLWKKMKSIITRTDTGQVIIYSYIINSRSEFELIIKKLMAEKLEPNIFEK